MGTRSLTRLYNDNKEEICILYRQFDGYPEGHGTELAEFLQGFRIVNGYNSDDKGKVANGAYCLAAQIISHFKKGVGGFYLFPSGTDGMDEEWVYEVHVTAGNEVEIVALEVPISEVEELIEKFRGSPDDYLLWMKEIDEATQS